MPFVESNGVRYFKFDLFSKDIIHAVFTRHGGISPEPWTSLNVGGTVGDVRERVIENRVRSFNALGRDPHSMFDVWQVHSADVVIANSPHHYGPPELKADAIITDRPDVTLFMRFADCVPILLHDPRKHVVGIVHAGWMGTVKKASAAAVKAMQATYGCNPANILAAIGPSIGPDHYEVGADVIGRVRDSFDGASESLLHHHDEHIHFDLWAANRLTLEQAGVEHILVSDQCTACHPEDWYSHRAQKGKTGRFGALIALA
jgi:purine-nucleoside/S-methyl-5'-thioadenosine phosphorylase / adenosine deaminase